MPGDKPPGAAGEIDAPMIGLDAFRRAHPVSTGSFGGVDWTWVAEGKSSAATMLLPPEPGFAAPLRGLIEKLSSRCRVIAPDIPAVPDAGKLVDGLVAICRAERVSSVNLVGSGFGGVLAQCFAQRASDLVSKVVLINTTTPEAWASAADRRLYNTSRWIPAWILRRTISGNVLSGVPIESADRKAWKKLIKSCLAIRKDKWELLSLQAAGFDAQRQAIESGGWELQGYEGRIQIVESGQDKSVTPAQRAALKASCPSAHVRKLQDSGKWVECVTPEKALPIIETFLHDVNIMDRTPGRSR